jgi:hypothetical protein
MRELTGKTVRISRGTSRGLVWESLSHGCGGHAVSFGPEIPRFRCTKMKGDLMRMSWAININDPRFEALNAVVSLLPKRKYKGLRGVWREADEWEIGLDEYRAMCGREGPL